MSASTSNKRKQSSSQVSKKKSSQKNKKQPTSASRGVIVCTKELKILGIYALAGLVIALILPAFGVSFTQTLSKIYGFAYMFLIPGVFIFRAWFKHRIFSSYAEEYGYPVLISWVLHSVLIAIISGVFKSPITDLNLYGSSFVLMLLAIGVFYIRE